MAGLSCVHTPRWVRHGSWFLQIDLKHAQNNSVLPGPAAGLAGRRRPAWAQKGTVEGNVVDAESGETLIGAHVLLQGSAIGSTTDAFFVRLKGTDGGASAWFILYSR